MKFLALLLCLFIFTHTVSPSLLQKLKQKARGNNDRWCREVLLGLPHLTDHNAPTKRRVETNKQQRCGHRMLVAVVAACAEQCNPGTEVDIYSRCCKQQCDYKEIRDACCPGR
uniref:Uncharacterized protein n=1 Tax=Caenorhabditis tropicalis TaxID=1561998 RepID=A0A1I7TIT1_9PELO